MFTTIIVSLVILLIISFSSLIYMWRSREKAVSELMVLQSEAATLREKSRMLEANINSQALVKTELNEAFKGMAATALESSMGQFLNLAQSTFERANEMHKMDSEQRHKALDSLVKPVSEALNKYQEQTQM